MWRATVCIRQKHQIVDKIATVKHALCRVYKKGRWRRREVFFLEKILLIQPLKSPSPGQKLYKRIPFSCHTCPLPLLWHEFDNCLCNFPQSKVSCCLHMYFLWSTICLQTNRKMIKMVTPIIYILYWHIWLLTLPFSSHALEMTINSYYTHPLSCFVFHLPKLLLKILFTQPFSIRCHPRHKFDQSPKSSRLIANSNHTFV